MSEKNGIEIDYCPECRGVWLDRGELEKLIERSSDHGPTSHAPEPRHYSNDDYQRSHHPHKRKKESFLGDLFDF